MNSSAPHQFVLYDLGGLTLEQNNSFQAASRVEEATSFYSRAEEALGELRSQTAAYTDVWWSLGSNLADLVSLVHMDH
jgi:hypothetical protein